MSVESHKCVARSSTSATYRYGKGMPSEAPFGQDSDRLAANRARRHESKSPFGSAVYLESAATRSAIVPLQDHDGIRNPITVEISKCVVEIVRGCVCRFYVSTIEAVASLGLSSKVRGNGTSEARWLCCSCYGREKEEAEAIKTSCSPIRVVRHERPSRCAWFAT